MVESGSNRGRLPLKWLYLAWLSLAFTWLVFIVCGVIEQGDPTQLIKRIFGDVALFAMGAYIVGLVISVLILRRLLHKSGMGWQSVGLRGHLTARGALYALLGWFIAFWLFYLVQMATGHFGIRMFWNEGDFFKHGSIFHMAFLFAGPVVVAPIAEEIIYRGFVLSALLARFRTPQAVTMSALIFASIHIGMGPGLAIYILLGAFIPAYLYLRFGNIYPCILMHLLNNIVVYFVIPRVFM